LTTNRFIFIHQCKVAGMSIIAALGFSNLSTRRDPAIWNADGWSLSI
jgi:hypothetical protein